VHSFPDEEGKQLPLLVWRYTPTEMYRITMSQHGVRAGTLENGPRSLLVCPIKHRDGMNLANKVNNLRGISQVCETAVLDVRKAHRNDNH
jgi:hypothetical protein